MNVTYRASVAFLSAYRERWQGCIDRVWPKLDHFVVSAGRSARIPLPLECFQLNTPFYPGA